MPDKEFKMHRILAQLIFKRYDEWYYSEEEDKEEAEKKLFKSLELRKKYPNSPRA
jgi:hypothetical protein|tara:strand:+ start:163 stop:327 length:165 start_codon:yes stop_codon:yes gene_type:complete